MSRSGQTKKTRWLFRFQFGLRSLLILPVIITAILCLWFRPYVIEKPTSDGQFEARCRVRRSWPGSVVAFGRQETFHDNGKISQRWMQWGGDPDPDEFDSLGEISNQEYWLPDGRKVDCMEWLVWLILETIEPSTGMLIDDSGSCDP